MVDKKMLWLLLLSGAMCCSPAFAENVHIEEINIPQVGGNHLNEIVNLDHIQADSEPSIEPLRMPAEGALPQIDRHRVRDTALIDNAIKRISANVDVKVNPHAHSGAGTSVSAVKGRPTSPQRVTAELVAPPEPQRLEAVAVLERPTR